VRLLIDYSSLLYRAYHSLPESLPSRGVYGFLNMLARLLIDHRPRELAMCVDDDWRPAFRTDALPSYKAHRVVTEEDEDRLIQDALVRDYAPSIGGCLRRGWELVRSDFWPLVGITALSVILMSLAGSAGGAAVRAAAAVRIAK